MERITSHGPFLLYLYGSVNIIRPYIKASNAFASV